MLKSQSFEILHIPFCIFGFDNARITNKMGAPITSTAYSIPSPFKSGVPNLPSYRIKQKLPLCADCVLSYKCDGFYSGYLTLFDYSELKPLYKKSPEAKALKCDKS